MPHAGHKRGRRCCCSRGRKAEARLSRNLSIFQRQRSGSGNGFLAVTSPRSYNTENSLNRMMDKRTGCFLETGQFLMTSRMHFGGFTAICNSLLLAAVLCGCAVRHSATNAPASTPEPTRQPATEPTVAPEQPFPAANSPKASMAAPGEYTEQGIASWYGAPFDGRRTSDGEIYDMHDLTAAHRTLPFNSIVRVTNLINGKQVNVRINDRGPFVANRVIDLSYSAARAIGMLGPGTADVRLDVIGGPDPSAGFFGVQVGAFEQKENADRLQKELSARYAPVDISEFNSPRGTYYRVRAGRLPSESAARELAIQIQKEDGRTAFVVRLDN